LLCGLSFYFLRQQDDIPHKVVNVEKDIVKPGGNNAYLTLANGQHIDLTDVEDGVLSQEAGVRIYKTADVSLLYETIDPMNGVEYSGTNTIQTPIVVQCHIRLTDCTRVWLYSSSSLDYSFRFVKSERRVILHGEAYSEVHSAPIKPSYVSSKEQA